MLNLKLNLKQDVIIKLEYNFLILDIVYVEIKNMEQEEEENKFLYGHIN